MVTVVDEKSFKKEVLDQPGLVFVDFWSITCPPCKMMDPVIEGAVKMFPNVKFFKVDINKSPMLAGQYVITSIPCIVVFKAGKEIGRSIGYRPINDFENIIKKYTQNSSLA